MTARELVAGTRASALALEQTHLATDALMRTRPTLRVHVQRITTTGDARADVPLATLGRGVFVAEIEQALRDGRIDFAVHSAKDLPSTLDEAVTIAAFLPREDARDALVSPHGTLADLPAGARVGTSSPRRACQVRALRPDLDVRDIRGNVDTRLRKLQEGQFDAIVIAAAGMLRLGRAREITEWLGIDVLIPCVGQGALAVEVRADDAELRSIMQALDDADTRAAVSAERAFLAELGAGCLAAAAAHAIVRGNRLELTAMIGSTDGRHQVTRVAGSVRDAERLGARAARRLLRGGAAAFLSRPDSPLAGMRVAVTRAPEQAVELTQLLRARGAEPVACPTIAVQPPDDIAAVDGALRNVDSADWLVFTSANAVRAVAGRLRQLTIDIPSRVRLAAVGGATAETLDAELRAPEFVASMANAEALAAELPGVEGATVLFARGDLALPTVPDRLRARGARVETVTVYRTAPGPGVDELRRRLASGQLDALLFASPSSIAFAADALVEARAVAGSLPPVVCIGPTTARAARDLGIPPDAVAGRQSVGGIVEALEACLAARGRATPAVAR